MRLRMTPHSVIERKENYEAGSDAYPFAKDLKRLHRGPSSWMKLRRRNINGLEKLTLKTCNWNLHPRYLPNTYKHIENLISHTTRMTQ